MGRINELGFGNSASDEDESERRDSERRNKWRVDEVVIVKIFVIKLELWIVVLYRNAENVKCD